MADDLETGEGFEEFMSMSDIYYLLLADLSDASELLDNAKIHANENEPRQPWATAIKLSRSKETNQCDIQNLYKKNILDTLRKRTEKTKPFGEPLYTAHAPLELRSKLSEVVKRDRENIKQMSTQLALLRESNNELSRQMEELKTLIAARTTSGEMKAKLQRKEVDRKIKIERAKLVKQIRHVTDEICPDSNVPKILSEVLKKSMSGKDPYVSVDDVEADDVELLLRCSVLTRHPHDRRRVRLSDLL
ncbi:Centromere protein K [Frankliniella fusca]|uniref:Centromere protein K n=1 Tax=Frankliniella fusca TaxID=407009 RepID=A0AAE1L6Y1_9NEOP|nr:Centromere protein K [Frankliniella fusca]